MNLSTSSISTPVCRLSSSSATFPLRWFLWSMTKRSGIISRQRQCGYKQRAAGSGCGAAAKLQCTSEGQIVTHKRRPSCNAQAYTTAPEQKHKWKTGIPGLPALFNPFNPEKAYLPFTPSLLWYLPCGRFSKNAAVASCRSSLS